MISYRLIGTLLLIVSPLVQSFVAHDTRAMTTTRLLQKAATRSQLSVTGKPLFLHVETLHPHRDTLVRLDDPIDIPDEKHTGTKNEGLHSFTNHLAPIVLALYMMGHFLSTYHASSTGLMDGSDSININPILGGYVLIGAGLYTIKWSIDKAFLSPA